MEIKRIRKILQSNQNKVDSIKESKRYYLNKTDILGRGVLSTSVNNTKDNILRNADNRITHNFHNILVDEKASYMFTYRPIIDINDDKNVNIKVNQVLGDSLERKLKDLCIEASNCGLTWCHYWVDQENNFQFNKVNTEEITPIYEDGLQKDKLKNIIRTYYKNEYSESGELKTYEYIEVWTDKDFIIYKFKDNTDIPISTEAINHSLGEVPFIEFCNNMQKESDLSRYKKQIDLYDKVMSGYANDIEDIQQIIYILENYGGEDSEFVQKLKRFKTIQLANNEIEGKGNLRTLQIDIPVEARKVLLEELKKQIYEFGQGLQQDVESVGNASGVALKFFYRKLELKSGNMETEFKESLGKLVRAILRHLNIPCVKIQQTYVRNMISNDLENAQIAQQSIGIIPMKNILQNHPWVDDLEEALKNIEKEKEEANKRLEDMYKLEKEEADTDE